jgi:hypothetical protein
MNGLPLNIQTSLEKKKQLHHSLTEEEGRLVIMHHNGRGYKGKFISEGQIPIMSLRRILIGCEDYFVTYSEGRWNVVVRTPESILLYEPCDTPPNYAVDLANRVGKAHSQRIDIVCGSCQDGYSSGYMSMSFLESQLQNLVPRF